MRREILLSLLLAASAAVGCAHSPPPAAESVPEDTWEYGVECRYEAEPEPSNAFGPSTVVEVKRECESTATPQPAPAEPADPPPAQVPGARGVLIEATPRATLRP